MVGDETFYPSTLVGILMISTSNEILHVKNPQAVGYLLHWHQLFRFQNLWHLCLHHLYTAQCMHLQSEVFETKFLKPSVSLPDNMHVILTYSIDMILKGKND